MTRLTGQAGAAAGLLAVLAAGIWFLGAVVAWSTNSAVVLTGLWFVLLGAGILILDRRRPALRWVLRGTFVATTVALLTVGAYTSLHETTVNETLETGTPASRAAPAQVDDLLAPQP